MIDRAAVSFVVPVLNGRRWLPAVLEGIRAECTGRPFEILAVEDGSTDGSRRWLREHADAGLIVIDGPRRGAAAAVNAGIREAAHPFICQVDQDVILQPGWLARLLRRLEDPDVAAAQGRYVPAPDAGIWARVMGRDLEWRYSRIRGGFTDHVCTGNTVYRASALHAVGLLDEALGYGYDNDLSYRLTAAGYRLAFCAEAVAVHRWRDAAAGYLRQQFGVGYGRLDVVRKHPGRARGDRVSDTMMMAHAPLTLASFAALAASAALAFVAPVPALAYAGAAILGVLAAERTIAGVAAWRTTGDPVTLAFPVAHFARDAAWATAIVAWCLRRIARLAHSPAHSMSREGSPRGASACGPREAQSRRARGDGAPRALMNADAPPVARPALGQKLLVVIPAYNEAASLPRVVGELRRFAPGVDVLVVNDGSADGTADLLPSLGVQWLTLSARVGVGGAVRAGLRYAVKHGYDYAVRIDGDGQHRAADIPALLGPIAAGQLDAVVGSRFVSRRRQRPTLLRGAQAVLAWCLTAVTGRRITDPTSGFCLFGTRALRLLARHHPTGYAEPELILLLHRNRLRVGEVPVRTRPRLKGRTSVTPARALVAFGRTLLALVIVPPRQIAAGGSDPW